MPENEELEHLTIRVPRSLVAQINEYVDQQQGKLGRVSRSDAIRYLLERALAKVIADAGRQR